MNHTATRPRWFLRAFSGLLALAVAAALCGLPDALAQGKGGGGGGGSSPPPPPPVSYSIEFLGDLGGVTSSGVASRARGMNNYGDIVGSAADEDGRLHGVLSTVVEGTRTLIILYDLLSEEHQERWQRLNSASLINDSGVILATASFIPTPGGTIRITLATTEDGEYDWEESPQVERLQDVLGFVVSPFAINVHGDMTGDYQTEDGRRAFLLSADLQAFLDLGVLHNDHNFSRGEAVNANLQIAGASGTNPGEFEAIFTSPETGMIGLGVFKAERGGFRQSWAFDLNEDGVVVGRASAGGWKSHAFRWDGTLESLGTLGGDRSVALSINNPGAIVGHAQDKDGTSHAFLYLDGHGLLNLSDLVVDLPAGFRLSRGQNADDLMINDVGQIAGTGYDADGIRHAYLLTPLP